MSTFFFLLFPLESYKTTSSTLCLVHIPGGYNVRMSVLLHVGDMFTSAFGLYYNQSHTLFFMFLGFVVFYSALIRKIFHLIFELLLSDHGITKVY